VKNYVRYYHRSLQYLGLLFLIFVVSACSDLFQDTAPPTHHIKHAKHVRPIKKEQETIDYGADSYALHLSLAKLVLEEKSPAILDDAEPHLKILENYVSDNQNQTATQPVIILEYTVKEKSNKQRVIAPFNIYQKTTDFPALLEIIKQFGTRPYILQDIKLAVVTITPMAPLALPRSNIAEMHKMINAQLHELIEKAPRMQPMEEARIQLQLVHFFIDNQCKEGAYLSIENAKQALASAPEESDEDKELAKNRLQELEALEDRLHKKMPFTLPF